MSACPVCGMADQACGTAGEPDKVCGGVVVDASALTLQQQLRRPLRRGEGYRQKRRKEAPSDKLRKGTMPSNKEQQG